MASLVGNELLKIWSSRMYSSIKMSYQDRKSFVIGVSTVTADGPAPKGARPSAGTVMTKMSWPSYLHNVGLASITVMS